jgi:hypothetical protein
LTTKKKYIQHNKQCYACGQEKGASFLGYDIKTLKTYCLNKCKNKQAIPAVELIPATNEELVSAIVGNYSKDDEEAIMSLLGKVASTRLRPAHILHVMKIAEMEGLPSIQATLLNIIEADMNARSMDDVELESFGTEREPEEEMEEIVDEMPEIAKEDIAAQIKAHEPIRATFNEKPVEPTREDIRNALEEIREEQEAKNKEVIEEDDNPFEI